MKTQDKVTAGIAAVGIIAAGLLASPDADAATIFVPGTRQNGQPTQVGPHYADGYGTFDVLIDYPRDMAPMVGSRTLDQSVAIGVQRTLATLNDGDTIYGESQGAIVATEVRNILDQTAGAPKNVSFVTYGDPSAAGGLLTLGGIGDRAVVSFSKYQSGRLYNYAAVGWVAAHVDEIAAPPAGHKVVRWAVTGMETRRMNWAGLLDFIGEANWPTLYLMTEDKLLGPLPGEEGPIAEVMGNYGRVERTERVTAGKLYYGGPRFTD